MRETSTVPRSTNFDKIIEVGESVCQAKHYDFVLGDTMCCDDFYEGKWVSVDIFLDKNCLSVSIMK